MKDLESLRKPTTSYDGESKLQEPVTMQQESLDVGVNGGKLWPRFRWRLAYLLWRLVPTDPSQ